MPLRDIEAIVVPAFYVPKRPIRGAVRRLGMTPVMA